MCYPCSMCNKCGKVDRLHMLDGLCPVCGKKRSVDEAICPFCGDRLPPAPPDAGQPDGALRGRQVPPLP